jgi:cytosine/adenosine deaminase-related metal-dependent hydrolase
VTDRILIRGGIVLTQDPALGEMPNSDVLIEDDKIAAIGVDLPADDARVIDASGDIVIPGFIDTHRHTWETCIRTCAPDFALITYFSAILDKFAPHYRPEDVHSATQWGALECINAGITTLVDWAHIMNTPQHADASVSALHETGIRSVFAYGFPNTSLVDWWFGPDYTGSVLTSDGAEARRLKSQYFSSDEGRITMGLATRGPGFCKPDVVQHDWELAKELDIDITVHVAMDRFGYTKGQITTLRDMDLLYPGTTYVHASHFTDEEWQLVADSGGNVSLAPQIEIQMAGRRQRPHSIMACRSGCPPMWQPRLRLTSSPKCMRCSGRSADASTRPLGTATWTASSHRPASSPRVRRWPGGQSAGQRWPASPIARAR